MGPKTVTFRWNFSLGMGNADTQGRMARTVVVRIDGLRGSNDLFLRSPASG